MKYSLIAAMTKNNVIGNKGTIPWHISEDMKLFKKITTGNIIVMGRKTFESLNNENGLPNRINVVMTKTDIKCGVDVIVVSSFQDIFELFKNTDKTIFFIGGASIYSQVINETFLDELHISDVKAEYTGDTVFPQIDFSKWILKESVDMGEFIYNHYIRSL